MKKRIRLREADKKVFMTKREQTLKKRLIDMLKDDGKGHKHAKYAARLANFDIQIVPLAGPYGDPNFTAAISFDDGVIYISEGFLNDPSTFYQLNVLMRHELAHNLMMHQVRMMHKIGDKYAGHFEYSMTWHELLNVIMDFEISNKRYTKEDKEIVARMVLNGKIIGGLVTENHRKQWQNMTLEEMYDAILADIDQIHQQILAKWDVSTYDHVNRTIVQTTIYMDTDSPSKISTSVKQFIDNLTGPTRKVLKDILTDIYEKIALNYPTEYSEADIEQYKQQIASASPTKSCVLVDKSNSKITELFTPEEKYFAMNVLKKIVEEHDEDQNQQSASSGKTSSGGDSADLPTDTEIQPGGNSDGQSIEIEGEAGDGQDDDSKSSKTSQSGSSDDAADKQHSQKTKGNSDNTSKNSSTNGAEDGGKDGNEKDEDEVKKRNWYKRVRSLVGNGKYSEAELRQILNSLGSEE